MFRRLAIFAVAVGWASGCQSCGPLEQGRYRCDPSIPIQSEPAAAPQCPGASRCGLEGFCHASGDVSVAWRCLDDNHCENGYACGLAASRISRECHDPQAADAGFACEADTDCVRGWHCGIARVCYDRAVAQAYPCRRTLGDADCAAGWRCGLDESCHDTAVGSGYPCALDSDCEQGWRCGLDLHCLDPRVDALRAVSTTLGPAEKVNPLLLDHAPELFAVSPVQSPIFNVPRQFLAYYDQGAISVLDLSVGALPPIGTNPHRLQVLPDAGEVTALASLGAMSLDPFGEVDVGSWTYVTRPDGGFQELHFRSTVTALGFDGTPWRTVYETNSFSPVEVAPDWLRVGTADEGKVPTLTAFDQRPFSAANEYREYFYGWGARSRGSFYSFTSGYNSDVAGFGTDFGFAGNRVVDLATLTGHRINDDGVVEQTDCSVIADSRGLFVQQHELARSSGFRRYVPRPLRVPPFFNQTCEAETGVPQSHRITGLSSLGRRWLAVSAHPLDGGVEQLDDHQVALIDVGNWWDVLYPTNLLYPFRGCYAGFNGQCVPSSSSGGTELPIIATTVLGPCRVCSGGELVALSALPGAQGGARLEVRCRSGGRDGGAASDSITEVSPGPALGTSCLRSSRQLSSSLGFDPVRVSTSNAGQLAFAGPRGHLWVGPSSATAVPVLFDEAPSGALGDGAGTAVFIGPDRIGWYAGPPFGILAFPLFAQDAERPVAAVAGAQQAMVTGARTVVTFEGVAVGDSPRQLAAADGTPTRFDPPYLAVSASRPDGGSTVVVSAGDVVLAANLQLAQPRLERRLVPSEGTAIISLLALPKPDPGALVTAFALTSSALFKVTAQSDQLWSATQAPLPPGSPIELWADQQRGRIGYSDGRVFSLETRVQIGASLFKHVDDYAQVCGQAYALAEGTLHRLAPDPSGGAVGQWQPVELDGGIPAEELVQGSMLPFVELDAGTTLYLFTRRGEATRMPVSCP